MSTRKNAPSDTGAAPSAARSPLAHAKRRLENGLTVIFHEDASLPVAAVNLWYGVGSKDEQSGRTGFAHLFEHLMFMGTERVPGSQFDRLMESGGGSNNATTSFDRTNYFASGPSTLLPTLLWLEADRMEALGAAMTQEKLDRQREVVRNERRQSYENRPYGRADLAINEALFPAGHPYHVAVIGTHEDLQAATVEDVRRFFDAFYVPSNASLVVAGDFRTDEVAPLIERLFGTLPRRVQPPHRKAEVVRPEGVERLVLTDDVQLSRVTLAWPTPAWHAEGDADLDLLASLLAHGRSSRLWKRLVRDEKLCADVAAVQASRELQSVFEIEATCPPGVDLARVEGILEKELSRLQADGPEPAELERALNKLEHSTLRRLEALMDRADQLNAYEHARGEPDSLAWDLARYRRVSVETARVWAREALPLERRLVARVVREGPRDIRPVPLPPRTFRFPRPESITTDGGLSVHLIPRPGLPLVAARLVLASGTTAESEVDAGLTQLALDAADEGPTGLSAAEFAQSFEQLGARMGLVARREHSVAALRSTRATFDEAFALLGAAVREPALREEDLARVRTLLVQQLTQRDDDPGSVAATVAGRRLFGPGHPLSWPADGEVATVPHLRDEAVRARCAGILRPEGASLLLAGDLSLDDAARIGSEALAAWKGRGVAMPKPVLEPAASRDLAVFAVHRAAAVQTIIRFAWPAPPRGPQRIAAEMLSTILGGSFTSRLNQNLRERNGFTYGVGTRLAQMPSVGVMTATSSVHAEVTGAALREFLSEMDRLAAGGVTDDERDKAAATLRNRRVQGTSGLDGLLDQLEEMVTLGETPDAFDESLRMLESVSAADLDRLAPSLIRPRAGVLVLVGDRETLARQVEGLGLPALVEVDERGLER